MQNQCAEIKIRAERRAGEILAEGERNPGGNPNLLHRATGLPPSYKDMDIERTEAHRWQSVARIPEPLFEREIARVRGDGREVTTAGLTAPLFPFAQPGQH